MCIRDRVSVSAVLREDVPQRLVGLVLERVGGESMDGLTYNEVLAKIRAAGRPLTIRFRKPLVEVRGPEYMFSLGSLQMLFHFLDKSGDQRVTRIEVLKALRRKIPGVERALGMAYFVQSDVAAQAEFEESWRSFDVDGDDSISWPEFVCRFGGLGTEELGARPEEPSIPEEILAAAAPASSMPEPPNRRSSCSLSPSLSLDDFPVQEEAAPPEGRPRVSYYPWEPFLLFGVLGRGQVDAAHTDALCEQAGLIVSMAQPSSIEVDSFPLESAGTDQVTMLLMLDAWVAWHVGGGADEYCAWPVSYTHLTLPTKRIV
eukprot:TRINITY_DN44788_c0_g1_i2.p1 TRINITY_DN44788_c0_g1~~TRINITY_DN44788_c0_g1_i2.p1  ORF type:complete len:316 (-),score=76.23 TRINITY_DN44788_c0_g1_i2:71-1018(-)